jgi:hypothetical protein
MASIFGKDPANQPAPDVYARERIEQEIAHLKKKQSVRHGPDERKTLGIFVTFIILAVLGGLYAMDPFFYSWYKGDAIKAYLYLRSYSGDQKAQAIAATGIFTHSDLDILSHRQGSFQDYYASLEDAQKDADTIINFMNNVSKLRAGRYDDLGPVDKIRYNLFCRWGIMPPTQWSFLNPEIKDE